jgi:hypothetical protein
LFGFCTLDTLFSGTGCCLKFQGSLKCTWLGYRLHRFCPFYQAFVGWDLPTRPPRPSGLSYKPRLYKRMGLIIRIPTPTTVVQNHSDDFRRTSVLFLDLSYFHASASDSGSVASTWFRPLYKLLCYVPSASCFDSRACIISYYSRCFSSAGCLELVKYGSHT